MGKMHFAYHLFQFFSISTLIKLNFAAKELYKETSALCGQDTSKILSQNGTDKNVWIPWSAAIVSKRNATKDLIVSGVIISDSIILTDGGSFTDATHSRMTFNKDEQYFVIVGTTYYGDLNVKDKFSQIISVTHIRYEPNLKIGDWATEQNVMALVHLSRPINISDNVIPICLPRNDSINEEESLVISGWNSFFNRTLMTLRMSIKSQKYCENAWRNIPEIKVTEFGDRYCALVNDDNVHTNCVNRCNGVIQSINGTYYLAGYSNNFYSSELSRFCYSHPSTLYFLWRFRSQFYTWINMNIRCGSNNFTCSNGDCTLLSNVCNGVDDCYDGSDEDSLICLGYRDESSWRNLGIKIGIGTCVLVGFLLTGMITYRLKKRPISDDRQPLTDNYYDAVLASIPWTNPEFEIHNEIDKGGFGTVWSARNVSLDKMEAIKKIDILKMLSQNPKLTAAQLINEENVISSIDSEYVVKCFGSWTEGPTGEKDLVSLIEEVRGLNHLQYSYDNSLYSYFLRLELCDGTLTHWMMSFNNNDLNKRQKVQNIIQMFQQFVNGLTAIHAKNIIHRDIHPGNILYIIENGEYKWKITDFGVSKLRNPEDSDSRMYTVVGRRSYRAPEMMQSGYSKKTDVFSLGLVMLEVLDLFNTENENSLEDIIENIQKSSKAHYLKVPKGLRGAVGQICQMLANQEERPPITQVRFIQ